MRVPCLINSLSLASQLDLRRRRRRRRRARGRRGTPHPFKRGRNSMNPPPAMVQQNKEPLGLLSTLSLEPSLLLAHLVKFSHNRIPAVWPHDRARWHLVLRLWSQSYSTPGALVHGILRRAPCVSIHGRPRTP
jgi:hypothetical protein